MHYLSTSNVGYLSEGFEYFHERFVYRLDQVRPRVDPDRTRRALSIALFTSSKVSYLNGVRSKILLEIPNQNGEKLSLKPRAIRLDVRPS